MVVELQPIVPLEAIMVTLLLLLAIIVGLAHGMCAHGSSQCNNLVTVLLLLAIIVGLMACVLKAAPSATTSCQVIRLLPPLQTCRVVAPIIVSGLPTDRSGQQN